MPRMRPLAVALILASSLASFAGENESLVEKLGADEWPEREEAMLACLDRPQMRPLLEDAATGSDPEVAWRARWALGCLDWDIDAALARRAGNPFEGLAGMTDEELQLALRAVMAEERPA